jgi:dephospho-CoA kinase
MRDDDSDKKNVLKKRDKRELKFGIGDVISTSDYMVVNEGSVKKFKSLLRSILKNEMRSSG